MLNVQRDLEIFKMTTDSRKREEQESTPVDTKRTRPGQRKFGFTDGPLDYIMRLQIPGYRLYLASVIRGNDRFRIQKLLDPSVGYEYVSPLEVGLTDNLGTPIVGDKIEVDIGGGKLAYLLKQPVEFYEEDRKNKDLLSREGLKIQNVNDLMGQKNLQHGKSDDITVKYTRIK
jgi:hypothetical protein